MKSYRPKGEVAEGAKKFKRVTFLWHNEPTVEISRCDRIIENTRLLLRDRLNDLVDGDGVVVNAAMVTVTSCLSLK